MKLNTLYKLFLVIFLFFEYSIVTAESKDSTLIKEYKVLKIERIKNANLIQVLDEKENRWFAIVSLRKRIKDCEKIKVGNTYKMKLVPYFKVETFPDFGFCYIIELEGKKIAVQSKGWAANVYTTQDLTGLCYINP